MHRDNQRRVAGLALTALLAAAWLAAAPVAARADQPPRLAPDQGIAIGGSVTGSTITNTVNQENPATLAMLAKAIADKDASEEKRREAEAKAAELATKWGFTSAAVTEVFRILGEQDVPEAKAPARLIEIATHFVQTRDALAALEPEDPRAAELAGQARQAFNTGRLAEADALLEQAKASEAAALREARQFMQRAQEAIDRHALNLAKLEASQAGIALTQLHYVEAARHYEAAAAQLPASAEVTKGIWLEAAGNALLTFGDLRAAMADYQAQYAVVERLAKADPGNTGFQHVLSVLHDRIGDVQQAQGDLATALISYRSSLGIIERLVKAHPGNASLQRDLAVSQNKIGDVLVDQGDLAAVLDSYRASLGIIEQLATADPGNTGLQRDLSVSHNKIGDVQLAQGDRAAALTSYQAALAIRERLAKADPGNAGWQRDLSLSHERIGDVQQEQGDLSAALTSYRASLEIIEHLAKADPGNAGLQRDLSVARGKIGDVQRAQGDLAAALTSYQADFAIAEHLAKADPGNARWQRDLSVSHERIGDVQLAQGDLAAALTSYQADLAIIERLAGADPGNDAWQRDLALSNGRLGEIYLRGDRRKEAKDAFEQALAIYTALATRNSDDDRWRLTSAALHLRLASLDPDKGLDHLQAALAILQPLADANRLNANLLGWIPKIADQIASLRMHSSPPAAEPAPLSPGGPGHASAQP